MSRPRLLPEPGARVWPIARLVALGALCLWAIAPASAVASGGSRLAGQLQQATGYSAAALESKPACGVPAPGHMSCRAELLAVRSTGQDVSLRARPHETPETFRDGAARSSNTAAASSAATSSAEPSVEPVGVTAPTVFTPAYLQWAYDLGWLSANKGAGDTIAIVDAYGDPNAYADMATFRSAYGLPACAVGKCFQVWTEHGTEVDSTGSPTAAPPLDTVNGDGDGWELEESLDIDAVSSLCPNCSIDLIEANSDSNTDLEYAVTEAHALNPEQISMSWGENDVAGCDTGSWWFAGMSSLAASGDEGYQGATTVVPHCPADTANLTSGTVSYPAAHSQVTAVGGTSLATANNARGFTESVWNDGVIDGSYYVTQSGCDTSQAPVPSYQSGVTTDCAGRAYNDIAADGDPLTGLAVYDSVGGTGGCSGWCVVGGTSLATPLTAAYEALVGITPTDSPAWAYSDANYLNEVTSGNDDTNETCLSAKIVICQAQTNGAWNGATGNGTISGDLITGAPEIGGAYQTTTTPADGSTTTSASVAGGIYPNGTSTTYQWDYGTTASYGTTVAGNPVSGSTTLSGSALVPVSETLTNLTPCTIYHFRLDASDTDATVYGYDTTLLTVSPAISGTPTVGDTLTAQLGVPDPSTCNVSYKWEESSSATGTFAPIAGATSSTYSPASTDVGNYIELAVTETNTTGQATDYSAAIGPIAAAPTPTPSVTQTTTTTSSSPAGTSTEASVRPEPPTVVANPTITSSSQVGAEIAVDGGVYENATRTVVQFFRCARTCKPLKANGVSNYRVTAADAGHYIKVEVTIYGAAGTTALSSTNWIGPITDAGAGVLSIRSGARIASSLRVSGSTGVALASARVTDGPGHRVKVEVSRPTKSPTSSWLCVIAAGAPVSCTAAHAVRTAVSLSVTLTRGESLKLIAVRT